MFFSADSVTILSETLTNVQGTKLFLYNRKRGDFMDIRRWKVMLAVSDAGSYTRAAEELGLTQSAVTQMMKALEKEVGFSLFVKSGRGMRPTPEAQSLLPSVRALLSADEVVRQEIASLNGVQTGTIRIGTYLSCSIHWIPGILKKFHADHPGIHFHVIEGDEGELADWIQERRVDIGFISRQEGQRYQFLPVMEDEIYAVLPSGHPLAEQEAVPLTSFEGAPFVTTAYVPGSDVHRVLKEHNLSPDIRFISINEFSVLSMVEQGLGVSLLPGLLLRKLSGNFVRRSTSPRLYRQLGLAYISQEELSPAARIFLEYAKDFLLDDE